MVNRKNVKVKKKSVFKYSGFYFVLVYALLTIIFLLQVFKLNVLPMKYIVPLTMILLLLLAGLFFLQMGKRMSKLNKILGRILIILLSLLLGIGNWYMFKTYTAFGFMTGVDNEISVVSVVVLKESSYKKLSDLENKKLGSVTIGDTTIQKKAINDVKKDIDMKTVQYPSFEDIADDLYNGNIDAILLNESNRGSFEDKYPKFDSDTRVIKRYTYKTKAIDISKKVDVTKEAFNVYITGIDTYGTIATIARSDVNMIATINPSTKQILLVSIPRDYYVPQSCQDNQNDKLTHTGIYGVSCTIDTAESLFGIDINYYARVNFSSLVEIVDALGGVTVNSPNAFTTLHGNYNIKIGENYLDGEKALGFVRERYAFEEGDRERGKNQMRVLSAIIDKATSPAIITKYTDIMDAVGGSFQTNMSSSEINSLIKMQINDMSGWNIQQYSVNGYGETNWSPANGFNSYVMQPDQSTVNKAIELIKKIEAGQIINAADLQ